MYALYNKFATRDKSQLGTQKKSSRKQIRYIWNPFIIFSFVPDWFDTINGGS